MSIYTHGETSSFSIPMFNYGTATSPPGGDTATSVLEQGLGAISYRT